MTGYLASRGRPSGFGLLHAKRNGPQEVRLREPVEVLRLGQCCLEVERQATFTTRRPDRSVSVASDARTQLKSLFQIGIGQKNRRAGRGDELGLNSAEHLILPNGTVQCLRASERVRDFLRCSRTRDVVERRPKPVRYLLGYDVQRDEPVSLSLQGSYVEILVST
jgi:hypothetical protein